jgi:D-aspartate ligase
MIGALVLGSDYRGLGAVQSLGRRGVDVWVLHDSGSGVASVSRYAERSVHWPTGSEGSRVRFLIALAEKHGLQGWVLFPTRDDIVGLCARNLQALSGTFRSTTPSWDLIRHASHKRLTYRLAARSGVPFPRTWEFAVGPPPEDWTFPSIIKPSIRERENALTVAKAWRVNDRMECEARYTDALRLLPADEILLQELIPGGGDSQLSFAALASDGDAICSMVVRRTRQFPMDIGRASTFVETVDDQEVAALGRRVVAELGHTGLVEVEFKRDPRTGEPKLLDINPRLWGWHTIGRRAGLDFAYLNWRLAQGDVPARREAAPGNRWMWLAGDVPTVAREIAGGRLRIGDYLRSFRTRVDLATLTLDDPVPGLVEVPLLILQRLPLHRLPLHRPHSQRARSTRRLIGGVPDRRSGRVAVQKLSGGAADHHRTATDDGAEQAANGARRGLGPLGRGSDGPVDERLLPSPPRQLE